MVESSTARRRRSKPIKDQKVFISKFGKCALALWPDNAPAELAHLLGCSDRHVNRLITGTRRATRKHAAAIADAIAS